MYIFCLFMPWKFFKILQKKQFNLKQINIKQMKFKVGYLVLIVALIALYNVGGKATNYYNESAKIRLSFNNSMNKRLVIMDNITKKVTQKFQIAKINDSSFYKSLSAITNNRADGMSLMFKLVLENNPNANFNEVSSMYRDLMNTIENERNQLNLVESDLSNISIAYESLHTLFPSSFYLFYEKPTLNYKVISTIENKEINLSGIDSNIHLK